MLCLIKAFPFWHVIEDLSLQGCEQESCQCVAEAKYLKRSYLGTIVEQFFFHFITPFVRCFCMFYGYYKCPIFYTIYIIGQSLSFITHFLFPLWKMFFFFFFFFIQISLFILEKAVGLRQFTRSFPAQWETTTTCIKLSYRLKRLLANN